MNKLLLLLLAVVFAVSLSAQDKEWPKLDVSVMDMAYYPQSVAWRNYLTGDDRTATPKIKLQYSRPLKKDREIFGALIPYGTEWRLGANEATTISFYQPVAVGGEVLNAGTYTLSALVNPNTWTINFSTERGIWGSDKRDMSKTVASVSVPVELQNEAREDLAMTFQEVDDHTVNLVVEWDGRRVSMPIALNPVTYRSVDASPMDMAHYPRKSAFVNYLEGDEKEITPKVQVVYSRPQKKGRDIFGSLLPYGQEWRVGANEATEITLYEDATIGGTMIKKGRYAMAVTPHKDRWDITFHKDFPIWGVHQRDTSKDVATISVPVTEDAESLEALSVMFTENEDGSANMIFGWETTRCVIPVKF